MSADTVAPATVKPPFMPLPQKKPDVSVEHRDDGSIIMRSNHAPAVPARSIAHLFTDRAAAHPDRAFMLQRLPDHGPWRQITYGQAKRSADGIAQWLIDRGLGQDDAVMVLSGNSIEHAVVMLGCYLAGVPVVPISPAYSLMSSDHAKLKHCFATTSPRVVFAQDADAFARAIVALRGEGARFTVVAAEAGAGDAVPLADLIATTPGPGLAAALDRIDHATVAKYLFTSGSTGMPKAVPQTHGMMTGMLASDLGLRDDTVPREPRVALEWMPWSHISAGNIFFNGTISDGGTAYLDDGRPIPGLFDITIRNLAEVSPHVFGSAPIAFAMLADAMERDPGLRRNFFRELRYMGYGGATLSNDIYERMQALAIAETGKRIPLVTMYGSTETQGVTSVHWASERVGLIGLPMPGVTLKLAPSGDKFEVRVKGPTVTRGYLGDEAKTRAAFDEEGFYKLGDAACFLDPADPTKGLVFDGRVTEDFKLSSGTWVSVGTLRPDILTACTPYLHDALVAGQDQPYIAILAWPSPAALQSLAENGEPGAPLDKLRAIVAARLAAFNRDAGGSSRRVGAFTLLTDPPSLDAGEITDKGYVNQRAALERRADRVAALYDKDAGGVSRIT